MDRSQIVKITNAPISESFHAVINRLSAGYTVDPDIIKQIPEIQLADQCAKNQGIETCYLDQEPRRGMQMANVKRIQKLGSYSGKKPDETGKMVDAFEGNVTQGKQMHFILGLPASGKSSALANKVSQEFNAKILDSDMVKEFIPEYRDGWGASIVHTESKMILNQCLMDSMRLGENVVIPKIGEPPENIIEMMKMAKQAGYECHAHYMDLDVNKALGRMFSRFVEDGRYCESNVLLRHLDKDGNSKMPAAFDKIKNSEYCDGWSEWTNDVDRGEQPILIAYEGISGRFLDDARTDIANKKVIEPEEPFVTATAQLGLNNIILNEKIDRVKDLRNEKDKEIRDLSEAARKGDMYFEKVIEQLRDMNIDMDTKSMMKNMTKSQTEMREMCKDNTYDNINTTYSAENNIITKPVKKSAVAELKNMVEKQKAENDVEHESDDKSVAD